MGTIFQNGILYSGSTGQNYSDMGGATSTTAGVHGLVPAPSAGDNVKYLRGDGTWASVSSSDQIFCDTTANWSAQTTLVSIRNAIYIYTDHQTEQGMDVPGFKVGDGLAYVVDLPFTDVKYSAHIADTVKHITAAERAAWNDKVRCYLDANNAENLVLTTN